MRARERKGHCGIRRRPRCLSFLRSGTLRRIELLYCLFRTRSMRGWLFAYLQCCGPTEWERKDGRYSFFVAKGSFKHGR